MISADSKYKHTPLRTKVKYYLLTCISKIDKKNVENVFKKLEKLSTGAQVDCLYM